MASFSVPSKELRAPYLENAQNLFSLCFFYTADMQASFSLMRTILSDLCFEKKSFLLSQRGTAGFFEAALRGCMDYFRKKLRKPPKVQELKRRSAPFPISDAAVSLLRLPYSQKGPLFFSLILELPEKEAAKALGLSESALARKTRRALSRAGLSREAAKKALLSFSPGQEAIERTWDRFETERMEEGFEGKQRLRLFKRSMDLAAPWAALCILLFCGFSYLAVHFGLLNGIPYGQSNQYRSEMSADPANDPLREIEAYRNGGVVSSSEGSSASLPLEQKDFPVFVWEEGEFHKYIVKSTPADPSLAALQMVALGGMPEGGEVLSCRFIRSDSESSSPAGSSAKGESFSLTLYFNEAVKEYLSDAQNLPTLQAMVYSFRCFYEDKKLSAISFCFGDEEILCGGKRASDFLTDPLPEIDGQAVPYRSLR